MLLKHQLTVFCLWFTLLESFALEIKYQRQIPSQNALKFMKKYGYLVDDGGQSEAIYSEENLSNIIKTMQKYGAIQETGIIDNATLKLMASRRCGIPDVIPKNDQNTSRNKRFSIIQGWNKRHITYYISNWSPNIGEEAVARNIQKALDIWGGYGRLKFTRSFSSNADIIVSFARDYHGDRYPFDGPGLVLAHAFFPDDSQFKTVAGDIHFDADEKWMDFSSKENAEEVDGVDFFTVALHELGHSLGLAHSNVDSSVMSPYYKEWKEVSKNLLDYDDILGMYELYIRRKLDDESSGDFGTSSTTPSPRTTTVQRRKSTSRRNKRPWPRTTTKIPIPTSTLNKTIVLYEGDDESVETHKGHDPNSKFPKTNSPSLPNICNANFDAVAVLRGDLFIFKDEYLWRLRDKGSVYPGYPTLIRQMFPQFSQYSLKKIDAAYQRPDGNIILFTGNKVWIYDGFNFTKNSPENLNYFQLPDDLDGIDAVQNWAKNGKTYFYKGDQFWRYNEDNKSMDSGYPMKMERWKGVPGNLDAAVTYKDGITYFFKGEFFWKFDNNWIQISDTSPLPIAPIWLGCKEDVNKMTQWYNNNNNNY